MTIAIPYWPDRRLVVGAHTIRLKEPKLAIHSNITPGKLAGESRHILMLDYDGETDPIDIRQHVADGGVENYFWWRTDKGFHVVDCTCYSWDAMRKLQIECHEDDMHHRMTERFGRAALALHPPKDMKFHGNLSEMPVGSWSVPHACFYHSWMVTDGDLEHAKGMLSTGGIAFRFYRKHSFIREVI